MTRRGLIFALAAIALVGARSALAVGPKGPSLEIRVIHALKNDGGTVIDPPLRDLPQLTKDRPFVLYNVFKLLDRRVEPLEAAKPVSASIAGTGTLTVTLLDVSQQDAGPAKPEKRYRMRAELGEPKGTFGVTASAGEPFFLAGQSYQGGVLFVEVVVR